MIKWLGQLYRASSDPLDLESPEAETYVLNHTRTCASLSELLCTYSSEPSAEYHWRWLPIQEANPSKGLLIAIAAIRHQLPFIFLEPGEAAEAFDTAAFESFVRHGASTATIGLFSRSSGSSGRPKLIPRSLVSWLHSFDAHREAFALDQTNHWLIPGQTGFSATIYHALLGLYLGKGVYLQGSLSPRETLRMVVDCKIDTLFTVPTRLGLILRASGAARALGSLKNVITVGELLSPKVNALATSLLPAAKLWHYYGAAELGQVAFCSYSDQFQAPKLLGRPFKSVSIAIDEAGNIRVDSPYLAMDYTDFATVYDKGYLVGQELYFIGREDLQFNRHGRKFNLEPLKNHLLQDPQIHDFTIQRTTEFHKETALEAYHLHLLVDSSLISIELLVERVQNCCKVGLSPLSMRIYEKGHYTSGGKIAWHKMTPVCILPRGSKAP